MLLQQICSRLGTIIQGQQDKYDPHVFFTEGFLARNKARVRGLLTAITIPTTVSTLINQNKIPERLFFGNEKFLISRHLIIFVYLIFILIPFLYSFSRIS